LELNEDRGGSPRSVRVFFDLQRAGDDRRLAGRLDRWHTVDQMRRLVWSYTTTGSAEKTLPSAAIGLNETR
jgi:hypothetical protein